MKTLIGITVGHGGDSRLAPIRTIPYVRIFLTNLILTKCIYVLHHNYR